MRSARRVIPLRRSEKPTTAVKVSVLVTGGTSYIGSHAVLDNLCIGFCFSVSEALPFFHGEVGYGILLARIFKAQGTVRSCTSPDRWSNPSQIRAR